MKILKSVISVTTVSYFFMLAFKMVLNMQADIESWDNWGPTRVSRNDEAENCDQLSMYQCFEDISEEENFN